MRTLVHEVEAVEALLEHVGQAGMTREDCLAVRRAARFDLRKILLHGLGEARVVGHVEKFGVSGTAQLHRRFVVLGFHDAAPKTCLSRARPRSQSFSTESCVLPMRVATSGNVKPSRCRSTIAS